MSHTTSIRLDKLTRNKKRFERYKNDVHLFKFLNNYFCILYINIFAYQSIFFFQSPEMSKTSSMELETPKQEITSRRKYLIGPIVFLHLFTFSMFNTVINLKSLLSLPSWKGTTCIPKRIGDERRKFPLSKQ